MCCASLGMCVIVHKSKMDDRHTLADANCSFNFKKTIFAQKPYFFETIIHLQRHEHTYRDPKTLLVSIHPWWRSFIPHLCEQMDMSQGDCVCESLKVAFVTRTWLCVFVSLQLNLPIMNRMSASLDLTASVHSQPPLMGNVDPSKIDEIRRTVYVGNLNSQVTAYQVCVRP